MSRDSLQRKMNAFWESANREADERKDSFLALERMNGMYRGLDAADRKFADQVLAEWLLSDEEAKRFDAVALIREFHITTAAPALRELIRKLSRSQDPGAPFERVKVEGLLSELDANGATSV